MKVAKDKELKWHLALLISRISLNDKQLLEVWAILVKWTSDKKESKIVRVDGIQALFQLKKNNKDLEREYDLLVKKIQEVNIPSINARIRKLNAK